MSVRIHFERSGGFAGPAMRRTCTVDSDALPAEEAEEVRSLVQAADIATLASHPARSDSIRPDAFRYRLTIEIGGRQHTVEVTDTDMPASLRPLVKWLAKRASAGSP